MNDWGRAALVMGASVVFACSSSSSSSPGGHTGGGAGQAGQGAAAGAAGAAGFSASAGFGAAPGGGAGAGGTCQGGICDPPNGPFTDFPEAPIIDQGLPDNISDLFGPGGSGNGPCLVEPEPNALFPHNWLRPRFRVIPSGQNVFELRLHADDETRDLFVYTTQTIWTMPKDMWGSVAGHVMDKPITVSVRGATLNGSSVSGVSAATTGTFTIALVDAAGSIVYWSIAPPGDPNGTTNLKGFKAGEEGVVDVLAPGQVQMRVDETANTPGSGVQATCIGCHTSTPDGKYASFTAQEPWGNALASIEADSVGAQPAFVTAATITALSGLGVNQYLGISTFSRAHWSAGDYIEITPLGTAAQSQLYWFNLETGASGAITRNGDSQGVGAPSWSHDGQTIAYMSTNAEAEGQPGAGVSDLYTVPYADRAGGQASAVSGAADSAYNEYYPAFSADDQFLAFDRNPSGADMYNSANAEVFIVPAKGGSATRVAANDPPGCSPNRSPGVTNSWPKWSPEVLTAHNGKAYYWMIFSSTRNELNSPVHPELYITGVVILPGGQIETHSAIYLWNQPGNESNHTPAWDVFKIPPVPIN